MPAFHKSFFFWNTKSRYTADGREIKPGKKECLVISNVEFFCHRKTTTARITYDDGTKTEWFPVNEKKPSRFAMAAMNFKRWAYASERA